MSGVRYGVMKIVYICPTKWLTLCPISVPIFCLFVLLVLFVLWWGRGGIQLYRIYGWFIILCSVKNKKGGFL